MKRVQKGGCGRIFLKAVYAFGVLVQKLFNGLDVVSQAG